MNDFTSTGCQPSGMSLEITDTSPVDTPTEAPTENTVDTTEAIESEKVETISELVETPVDTPVFNTTTPSEETLRVMDETGNIISIKESDHPDWKIKFRHWSGSNF